MKIYNEIVIDMNPESSSYGETLHEDSYEYEGDMMLMQEEGDQITTDEGRTNAHYSWRWETDATGVKKMKSYMTTPGSYKVYTYTNGMWSETGSSSEKLGTHYSSLSEAGGGKFSYSGNEFDPTSEEFRKSVEETGGFGEIAEGYGYEETDFDEFYRAPLDYIKEQFGEGGTQQRRADLALGESKEAYTTGLDTLGLQTSTSLGDIYEQQGQAMSHSGLESSGSVDYAVKKARKGVFQDYKTQQKELATAKIGAQSIFDISEDERKDTLGFKKEEFWKTTEDEYYTDLDEMESAK